MSSFPLPRWPFDIWGVECGTGWAKLYTPLIEECLKEDIKVLQVKEKFGGLRFYVHGGSEHLHELIDAAELLSYKTCETCEDPGSMRNSTYWLKTLCDSCESLRQTHKDTPIYSLKDPTSAT